MSAMIMEAEGTYATSANFYQITRCSIPKDCHFGLDLLNGPYWTSGSLCLTRSWTLSHRSERHRGQSVSATNKYLGNFLVSYLDYEHTGLWQRRRLPAFRRYLQNTLKMNAAGSSKILITTYESSSTRCKDKDKDNQNFHRSDNLTLIPHHVTTPLSSTLRTTAVNRYAVFSG